MASVLFIVVTYSLVSKVMMMRMGLLFMPPTQLLLHMKLYRMVVNSVPTWNTWKCHDASDRFPKSESNNSKGDPPPEGSVGVPFDVIQNNGLHSRSITRREEWLLLFLFRHVLLFMSVLSMKWRDNISEKPSSCFTKQLPLLSCTISPKCIWSVKWSICELSVCELLVLGTGRHISPNSFEFEHLLSTWISHFKDTSDLTGTLSLPCTEADEAPTCGAS